MIIHSKLPHLEKIRHQNFRLCHHQPRWRELPWNRRNQRTDVQV